MISLSFDRSLTPQNSDPTLTEEGVQIPGAAEYGYLNTSNSIDSGNGIANFGREGGSGRASNSAAAIATRTTATAPMQASRLTCGSGKPDARG